ncbi:MAG TPA: hypothetical protein VEB59_00455 [Gemmatimonadales bacterium]|nr:hypothetical protein [Gemmatimonadales bacterium]
MLLAACGSGAASQPPADGNVSQATVQQATLPAHLCDLVPKADAERIMRKSLVPHRNDDSGCEYRDARGTSGTGLSIFLNAFEVRDQCRLTRDSEPLSGIGDEACIAIGLPAGLYTTVVFRGGGRTFEVVAPGEDRDSELATAVAKVILSKLGS